VRDLQIEARKDEATGEVGKCVLGMLIVFAPLCLVISPVIYAANRTANGAAARASIPYMDALPSDAELAQSYEAIKDRQIEAKVATRVVDGLKLPPGSNSSATYPRLTIRPKSATFTSENRVINVTVVVQGQATADVTWPPTEHSYHLRYNGHSRSFHHQLADAEARIAGSIAATYGLRPSSRDASTSGAHSVLWMPAANEEERHVESLVRSVCPEN
jgi:hypothetical protein